MPLLIAAVIILILIAVAVLVFGAGGVRAMRQRQESLRDDAVHERVPSLRYVVPTGQDPAAVMAALMRDGFQVVRDDAATHSQDLLILCPAGIERERARARAVIAHEAGVDMEGHPMPEHAVFFADEPRTS
jgi:hypothetical protein